MFCVHGGISEALPDVALLETDPRFRRPPRIPQSGAALDLLWADPSKTTPLFAPSARGAGSTFGADAAADFLCENGLDVIVRAREVVQGEYEFPFEPDKSVLTVFSCPNYAYECTNAVAALLVDAQMQCSFRVLYSREPEECFEERVALARAAEMEAKRAKIEGSVDQGKPP
jgi:diadenosine tetraphosphatase ApaH/serine/threonine PP2A family protein phosphatase